MSEPATRRPEMVPGDRRTRVMVVGELLLLGGATLVSLGILWNSMLEWP